MAHVYGVHIKYFDPNYIDDDHPNGQKNGSSFMYRGFKNKDCDEANKYGDACLKIVKDKRKEEGKKYDLDYVVDLEYKGEHRWWLEWFCHVTDKRFDCEQDAFDDFSDFVSENNLWNYDMLSDEERVKAIWPPMGANDKFRWKLCKCEHCEKQGVTRIIH